MNQSKKLFFLVAIFTIPVGTTSKIQAQKRTQTTTFDSLRAVKEIAAQTLEYATALANPIQQVLPVFIPPMPEL